MDGIHEEHRAEFHRGSFEGHVLGDDSFSEKSLARAEEKFQWRFSVKQVVAAVCKEYGIKEKLADPGKEEQPAATGRAVAACLVQDAENLTLTELENARVPPTAFGGPALLNPPADQRFPAAPWYSYLVKTRHNPSILSSCYPGVFLY